MLNGQFGVSYDFNNYNFKVYKAISDSLETYKIINCIVFSIILNYLIPIIKLWMGSVYAWKRQQNHNNL